MKTFRVEMKSVCFITLPSCPVAYNSWLRLSLSAVARELDCTSAQCGKGAIGRPVVRERDGERRMASEEWASWLVLRARASSCCELVSARAASSCWLGLRAPAGSGCELLLARAASSCCELVLARHYVESQTN